MGDMTLAPPSTQAKSAYLAGRELASLQSIDPQAAEIPAAFADVSGWYRVGIEDGQLNKPSRVATDAQPGTGEQPVPPDALGRVFEAMKRSMDVSYLGAEASSQLQALLRTETLWALAIVFGVWAGLQFLPVGPLVDAIMLAAQGYVLMSVFGHLKDAVVRAAGATSSAQLDAAAKTFAGVWVEIGIDTIAGLVGSAVFRKIEQAVLKFRPVGSLAASKVAKAPKAGPRPKAPAEPVPEPIAVEPAPEAAPAPSEPLPKPNRPGKRTGEVAAEPAETPGPVRGAQLPGAQTRGRYAALAGASAVAVAPAAGEALGSLWNVGRWLLLAAGGGAVVIGGAMLIGRAPSRRFST